MVVLPGVRAALSNGMREGDVWLLTLTSHMAFGSGGRGGIVGPDDSIRVQLELVNATTTPRVAFARAQPSRLASKRSSK